MEPQNLKQDLDAAFEAQWQRMDDMLTNFEQRVIENMALVLRESETRIVQASATYTRLNEKALEKRLDLPPAS
jgi:hypothetical protein